MKKGETNPAPRSFYCRRLSLDLLVSKVWRATQSGIVYGFALHTRVYIIILHPVAAHFRSSWEEMTFFYGNISESDIYHLQLGIISQDPIPKTRPTFLPNVPHIRLWFFPLTGPWMAQDSARGLCGISRLCTEMKTHKNPFLRWLVNIFLFFVVGRQSKDIERNEKTAAKREAIIYEKYYLLFITITLVVGAPFVKCPFGVGLRSLWLRLRSIKFSLLGHLWAMHMKRGSPALDWFVNVHRTYS